MEAVTIAGGRRLAGSVTIAGAKNAALPLMIASLLTAHEMHLGNVPAVSDVTDLIGILRGLGVVAHEHAGPQCAEIGLTLNGATVFRNEPPLDLSRRMRASFWVIGPLTARLGAARVPLPGGCRIGPRPVDLHLDVLRQLGADIDLDGDIVAARAPRGLRGGRVQIDRVSVGATHTALLSACLAVGESRIENVAREPEVTDLIQCLVGMGALIDGVGTGVLTVQGVGELHGVRHRVVPDRIEACTFALAAAVTDGEIRLLDARPEHLASIAAILEMGGVELRPELDGVVARRSGYGLRALHVRTAPYPGLPTDVQAQLCALLAVADGVSTIRETIFEDRFHHVGELCKMGAQASVSGDLLTLRGVRRLHGVRVDAADLRGASALALAGLGADGVTELTGLEHLDRGYADFVGKLARCGAEIERRIPSGADLGQRPRTLEGASL